MLMTIPDIALVTKAVMSLFEAHLAANLGQCDARN